MKLFSDLTWLEENTFSALSQISRLLNSEEPTDLVTGREALIRILEHRQFIDEYSEIIDTLIQKSGLYPYLQNNPSFDDTSELLNFEFHKAIGLKNIYLHAPQAAVYRALMEGENVILSAPTSFGKSLLIDAVIASSKFSCIVVIVPTIALIDETRRRLNRTFSPNYKIITHPTQKTEDSNIFVFTQERFLEFEEEIKPQFFVIDEFYKLSPERGDERTFILNEAFSKLLRSEAQFFLIGPNIEGVQIDEDQLIFKFFRFDSYSTVVTEVIHKDYQKRLSETTEICLNTVDPTLIFCQSPNSGYKLGQELVLKGLTHPTDEASELADWLRESYYHDWLLPDLLDHGIALHYASLPRSVSFHILRLFNEEKIKFLLCTSTIIEGVNTRAKNIIVYDHKIGRTPIDNFTYSNIKGRAGRMFQHFVGKVYVMNAEPDPSLPIIDVPAISQPENSPESLLIQLDDRDLSDRSKQQLKYLHAQDYLSIEVIKQNRGIEPEAQINLANEISSNIHEYSKSLTWKGYPKYDALETVCDLIFKYFLNNKRKDNISSGKQLAFKIFQLMQANSFTDIFSIEAANTQYNPTPSIAVESTLSFLRKWCEFHFPRYLMALYRIQKYIFEESQMKAGEYLAFHSAVKHLFMDHSVAILEEYGLPFTVTQKILDEKNLGDTIDEVILNTKAAIVDNLSLTPFEQDTLNIVQKEL